MTSDELIKEHTNGTGSAKTHSLVIDFHPQSNKRIGLIEINAIYAYTYADDNDAEWTPLMLKLQDVYYEEFDKELSAIEKAEKKNRVILGNERNEIVEFLYVNGKSLGWNWGRNGMTNAAFLRKDALQYFKQFT